MSRELNSNRHSVYSLKYHLVVITKYRHECITSEMLKELEKIFTRLLNNKDCAILEFGGENDHVHICIISTGGATIETIKEYIENQGKE